LISWFNSLRPYTVLIKLKHETGIKPSAPNQYAGEGKGNRIFQYLTKFCSNEEGDESTSQKEATISSN